MHLEKTAVFLLNRVRSGTANSVSSTFLAGSAGKRNTGEAMYGKVAFVWMSEHCKRASYVCQAAGVAIAVAMLNVVLLTSPVQAYTYTCSQDKTITYAFGNINNPNHPAPGEIPAVEEGMNVWAHVANLEFVPGSIGGGADTWITWYDQPLSDGPGGVRAYSSAPCNGGDISFDSAETWSLTTGVPFGQPVRLQSFTTHETGHAIGLGESTDPASVMYQPEMYQSVWTPTKLAWDDIAGVQWIYGRANGVYHQSNTNTNSSPSNSFLFQNLNDKPVTGDWNGDGIDTIGVYRPSNKTFYLDNSNHPDHGADKTFVFGSGVGGAGNAGDRPVTGDWNGDGIDTIGVYRPSNGAFYLRNSNSAGAPFTVFGFGNTEDLPVAGDWNEDGIDTIGVYRPSNGTFYLKNANNGTPPVDYVIPYGNSGNDDLPVIGDWNASGTDTVGIYRLSEARFYLNNVNAPEPPDLFFYFGVNSEGVKVANRLPVAGDWDADGTTTVGLFQN
jgi:matrixin